MTVLTRLLKLGILNNDKVLMKSSLKQFIKFMRTSRPYKEYLLAKKHLELTVIREVLTQPMFLEYAIRINCQESFTFLLKEFRVSYKEKLFESNEKCRQLFRAINLNGNL